MWCPEYREKIFERADIRKRAEQLIREISEDYGFEVMGVVVAKKHVHIARTVGVRMTCEVVEQYIEYHFQLNHQPVEVVTV